MSLAPRRGSNVAGGTPGKADSVDPSILGSVDCPVVPDGDDPATPMAPCDAVDLAGASVVQDEVNLAIPDAISPMCDGGRDGIAPKVPCEDVLVIPVRGSGSVSAAVIG